MRLDESARVEGALDNAQTREERTRLKIEAALRGGRHVQRLSALESKGEPGTVA